MHIVYPDRKKFGQTLKEAGNSSLIRMIMTGVMLSRRYGSSMKMVNGYSITLARLQR